MAGNNRLKFQKQSTQAPVGSTQTGDAVIGLRDNDFISIPLDLLGGGVAIQNWDPAASEVTVPFEVIPFLRLNEFSVWTPEEWSVPPTTNGAKTTLTKAAETDQDTSVAGQFAGHLPATGKYWFIVQSDNNITDSADSNWVELIFSRKATYVGTDTEDQVARFGWGWDWGFVAIGSTFTDFTDALTGGRKYLVCVDIDAGKLDFYASNGLTATVTVPAYAGSPAFANAFFNFAVYIYDGTPGTLTFSVTPGDTPFAIPGGYLPLITREADAEAAKGKLNLTSSASVIRDYQIEAGRAYLVDAEAKVFEVVDSNKAAKLDAANTFAKKATFSEGIGLPWGWYLRSYQNGSYVVTQSSNPASPLQLRSEDVSKGPNTVIGRSVLTKIAAGQMNVAIASYVLADQATTLSHNVLLGHGFANARYMSDTVALGRAMGNGVGDTEGSVIIGAATAGMTGYKLTQCTVMGQSALGSAGDTDSVWNAADRVNSPVTEITGITAIGGGAYYRGKLGNYNTVVGYNSYTYYGTGVYGTGVGTNNTLLGADTLSNRQGDNSRVVAVGKGAMMLCRSADDAVAVGFESQWGVVGHRNVSIGAGSLKNSTQGAGTNDDCTAVGYQAMQNLSGVSNSSALGKGATVTGSNQVQLGDSATTVYAYGAVQNRSDIRDKTAVRDTILGLDFILRLRPVDYKLDMREDYIDWSTRPLAPEALREEPQPPSMPHTEEGYQEALLAYNEDHAEWLLEKDVYDREYRDWEIAVAAWDDANSMANIQHDGTHTRNRFHHGLIAQELKAAADEAGVDFGGYQDHGINGGQDVKSIGYEELIAPTIRAVQQLHEIMNSDAFVDRVASRMMEMMAASRNGG